MNNHPHQIWQAWLSGKDVQIYADGRWKDANPNDYPVVQQPQCRESHWRLRPEGRSFRYCVALFSDPGLGFKVVAYTSDNYDEAESDIRFIRWHGEERVIDLGTEERE